MRIPRSVKIRGVRYRVRLVNDPPAVYARLTGGDHAEGLQGFVLFEAGLIYLNRKMTPDAIEQAFAHELAHILAYNLSRSFSEGEVDALGAMLRELAGQI